MKKQVKNNSFVLSLFNIKLISMNYRVLFNLGVSSVAGAALLTLALVSVFSNVEKRKTAYFFLWSLVSALIPVSVIIVLYALKAGNSCPVIVAKILGTFIQVSVFGASYAFMLYCLAYFDILKRLNVSSV